MATSGRKSKMAKEVKDVVKTDVTKKYKNKLKDSYGLGAHQMLKGMNPYYKTIQDPFHVTGVKIPDLDIQDSEAFHIRSKLTGTTNASGNFYFQVGFSSQADGVERRASLIPKVGDAPSAGGYGFYMGNSDPLCTPVNLLAGTYNAVPLPQWSISSPVIPNKYTHARLVSGCCSYQVLAATNNSSGKISAAFFPKDKLAKVRGTGNLSIDQIENQQDSIIVPLNEFKPFILRYKPVDKSLLEYWPLDQTPINARERGEDGAEPGSFLMCITGAAPAQAVQIIVHMNYEGLVRDQTYASGGTDDVYVDSNALDQTFQEIANLPTSTTSKTNQFEQSRSGPIQAGQVGQPTPAKHPQSMLETIVDTIPTIMEKGVGVATKLAPLLALL